MQDAFASAGPPGNRQPASLLQARNTWARGCVQVCQQRPAAALTHRFAALGSQQGVPFSPCSLAGAARL